MQPIAIQTAHLAATGLPQRVVRMHPVRKQILVLVLLWLLLFLLAAAAMHNDLLQRGGESDYFRQLKLFMLLRLPLVLLSIGLLLIFERMPTRFLRARNMAWFYFVLLITFLPCFVVFEVAVQYLLFHGVMPPLENYLLSPKGPSIWFNGMLFTATYVSHVSYILWYRARQRMVDLQMAHHDNLALRLSLLQGQLEPQFLLSSLDGIGDMVRDAERPQAVRALVRLSDLLRYALRSGQQERLSVADEIGFMRDYLDLQVLRFGARLQVQWSVGDCNWALYVCPALLLHHLIEQTINEGLRDGAEKFALAIGFSLQNGGIQIVIRYSQALLPTPHISTSQAATITTVRERLQILYGHTATIEAEIGTDEIRIILNFPTQGSDDE